jgi:hypothetical protein
MAAGWLASPDRHLKFIPPAAAQLNANRRLAIPAEARKERMKSEYSISRQ